MSGMSQYEADRHLNTRYRSQAVSSKLTNAYIALFNGDPASGGTELAAIGNYARASVAVADGSWSAPASDGVYRYISNVAAVIFNSPTADWNSGSPIGYFAVMDSSSGGNRLESGQLPTPRVIVGGDNPPQFPAGALRIRVSAAG